MKSCRLPMASGWDLIRVLKIEITMRVVRETTIAGKIIHRKILIPSGNHKQKRRGRLNVTKESVKRNNMRLAIWRLWMLLAKNFDSTGSHVTLTYSGAEPTKEQAAADRKKMIAKLRKEFRKKGKELKYVVVTEYKNKRIHHHIVINSQDVGLITKLWGKGIVRITALKKEGDYYKLAEYLIKETEKTFRDPDSQHKQRYSRSRNLIMPQTKRDETSLKEMMEDPTPISGYYIPKDRVRRYEHPVTGIDHLEYIEVALEKPRNYKVWPRGKVVTPREHYKITDIEEQEVMDLACEGQTEGGPCEC